MKEKFEEVVSEETRKTIEAFCSAFQVLDFECWMVGGSIRDIILGKEPHDFDFASNCPVEDFEKMFKKVIPTGIDHGTVTVKMNDHFFEVTRFRRDVATDGRRATIEFAETIKEDLNRRDFTVNAIAFNPATGEIVDPHGGLEDLENNRLKFVGDLETRIKEDHLRALRFIRFQAGEFGLEASEEDFANVVRFFDESILSQERINDEIMKIFLKFAPEERVKGSIDSKLCNLGVFKRFFQGKGDELWKKALVQMVNMKSMFPMAVHVARFNKSPKSITSLLKLPSEYKDWFLWFEKMVNFDFSKRGEIKRFLCEMGKKDRDSAELQLRDLLNWRMEMGEMALNEFQEADKLIVKIGNAKEPFTISHLKVNGDDLKAFGFEGPEIGAALRKILEAVWKEPNLNNNSFKSNVKLWKLIKENENVD